jgi:hypothetical protein
LTATTPARRPPKRRGPTPQQIRGAAILLALALLWTLLRLWNGS